MHAFNIGSRVEWTSQSSGYVKHKTGTIVQILKAGERPTMNVKNPGLQRDHESYVIQVGKKFYWPRVNYLKSVS